MDWKPKKWVSVLLGFLMPPMGMLYLCKPKLALFYFLLSFPVYFLDRQFFSNEQLEYITLQYIVNIICALHAYLIASNFSLDEHRPWWSKWYGLIVIPSVFLLFVFCVRVFVVEPFSLPSASMSPSFNEGEYILVSKLGFRNYESFGLSMYKGEPVSQVARGSAIVFDYPKD